MATRFNTELETMREILSQAGYRPADAEKLQREGMGPSELEYRLQERGGLERTHGLRKRTSRRSRGPTPFSARRKRAR